MDQEFEVMDREEGVRNREGMDLAQALLLQAGFSEEHWKLIREYIAYSITEFMRQYSSLRREKGLDT